MSIPVAKKVCQLCGNFRLLSNYALLRGNLGSRFPSLSQSQRQQLFSTARCDYGIYEPEDLPPPSAPTYDLLNIRLRGYDFTVVEHHMYYVTKLASSLGAEIVKRWAAPAEAKRITVFKPQSTLVEHEYNLDKYDRTVQIGNISASVVGTLLDTLNSTLPEGVTLTIKLNEPADEEFRYIPDYELNALKTELEELGGPVRPPRK